MGTTVSLTAADGHSFDMYLAKPEGSPKGAIVICPEIFGIHSHIQSVADQYAADGYITAAPALFDRVQRNYVAGYTQSDIEAGIAIMQKIPMDRAIADTQAAVNHLKSMHDKVAVIGYCWGGTVAWVASAQISGLSASIAYYPGGLVANADIKPTCPVMLQLGEHDKSPPADAARQVLANHPTALAYFYNAGHGFNCDQRGSFDKTSADLARERSLAFLQLASSRWMP